MSFEAAITFLNSYRSAREAGLRNSSPIRWSTADVGSYSDLINTFSTAGGTPQKINDFAKKKLEVSFTASARRDVRMQFAKGVDHDPRMPLDNNVFEIQRLRWSVKVLSRLKSYISSL